jgi:hypothetical protein
MSETTEEILSQLNKLKETGMATHLETIDPLWNVPNQFVNSIETLLIILTKTSSIPVIPDYSESEVYTGLGITSEQAKLIQESNQMLLQLQTYIEKYCVQQYTLASYVKQNMDEIVSQIPEADMSNLIDFITNYNLHPDKPQMGGTIPMNILIPLVLKFLFVLLIALPSGLGETTIGKTATGKTAIGETAMSETAMGDRSIRSPSLKLISSDKSEQYEKGIISFPEEKFVSDLFEKSEITSGQVNVNNMVVQYDAKVKEQVSGFIGSIVSYVKTSEDGQMVLQNMLQSFNTESRKFSRSVEGSCIDLMIMAKDKGVFNDWRDMDSLKETNDKIQNVTAAVDAQNEYIKSGMYNKTVGAVISGVAAPLTGDFATPAAYVADLGGDLWEYISSTKKVIKETKAIVAEKPASSQVAVLSETEKKQLEAKIFTFSKLYCSFGYNLQLELQGTNITVIGDKIEYLWMVELIDTLESNLKFQITQASLLEGDEKSKQLTITILESLNQRLGVLKAITDSLYNIVNFSFKIEMLKLSRFPSPNNMEEFQSFLTAQLDGLNKMLVSLNKQFPKRASELELQKKQIEEDIELKSFEEEIKDMVQNATSIARQRASDRRAKELGDWWTATETVGKSWVDMGVNATDFGRQSLGKAVESIAEFGAEGPLALVRSVLKFVNNVLYELLTSPSGWIIIIGGLFTLTFMFGGITGTIRIFKKGGELFLTISWGGILFVYKVITTPFGYIYSQIATMRVNDVPANAPVNVPAIVPQIQNEGQYGQYGEANYQAFLADQEEGEEYEPTTNYLNHGGKRRSKGRKTRKNKRKRTRKLKRGKRKQTKHRKSRPTKKR